jgi:predicted ester cyclase
MIMKKGSWLFIAVCALLVFAGVIGSPLFAQDANDPEANKGLLLAWWEAEAEHTYDRMDTFFTEDIVRHSAATSAVMPDTVITNLDEYTQFLQGTAAMFPDYRMTPLLLCAEDEYVAFYGMFSGTFAANGNLIEVPMAGFARFEDGKIAELWVEWDNVTWNAQMGEAPPETGG